MFRLVEQEEHEERSATIFGCLAMCQQQSRQSRGYEQEGQEAGRDAVE